ncbi:MAG: NAD-dependent epimerase/dehydratase family protein [Chloroflexi bacterium]|nr:MAG: NAD-dependent epimerase/dehydratase family protein [Chloroflexota bacterium]
MAASKKYVLVVGGGTFLGDSIAAALLAEGAEVTLLTRPGAEEKLGLLAQRVRLRTADVWNPASLKGQARGHTSVVNAVGSTIADPSQGLNYNWLNFVSARNVANMCVSDGVSHLVLLSSVAAPWLNRRYIRSKRDAENYVRRIGLKPTIIRAPVAYVPGQPRPLVYRFVTLFGKIPPLSWLYFGKRAPMPVDVMVRGIARITLEQPPAGTIFYASQLRKYGKAPSDFAFLEQHPETSGHVHHHAPLLDILDEDTPFGWSPPGGREDI